jgi:glyoxylase-like metal-dependent hydrolase (beta-lactamase superfamily II)
MIRINLSSSPVLQPPDINVFLLTGEPLTLVDTGFHTDLAWESLNSQLAEHGFRLKDLEQVVLTHSHPDHFGLAARIADNADVEILSHKDAASLFLYKSEDHKQGSDFLFETLRKSGAPEGPLAKRLKPRSSKPGKPLSEPIEVTKLVRNGSVVSNGAESWEVMELPGHSPGMIGLYCKEKKELIASDHLLPEINSRPGLYRFPGSLERDSHFMGAYLETLKMINQMDLNVAWPSHGEAISDVRTVSANWIEKHNLRTQFIAEPLGSSDKTAYQIWKSHFPHIMPFDPVKGLVEIITYLDLFVSKGKIKTYQQDGLIYYHLLV